MNSLIRMVLSDALRIALMEEDYMTAHHLQKAINDLKDGSK